MAMNRAAVLSDVTATIAAVVEIHRPYRPWLIPASPLAECGWDATVESWFSDLRTVARTLREQRILYQILEVTVADAVATIAITLAVTEGQLAGRIWQNHDRLR
jgi:hypothetical protein